MKYKAQQQWEVNLFGSLTFNMFSIFLKVFSLFSGTWLTLLTLQKLSVAFPVEN